MKYSTTPIGPKIKKVAKQKGVLLKHLAKRIGVANKSLSLIFRKNTLSTSRLRQLSEELDTDFFQYLLADETKQQFNIALKEGENIASQQEKMEENVAKMIEMKSKLIAQKESISELELEVKMAQAAEKKHKDALESFRQKTAIDIAFLKGKLEALLGGRE